MFRKRIGVLCSDPMTLRTLANHPFISGIQSQTSGEWKKKTLPIKNYVLQSNYMFL